jgi:hypothetical protein
LPRYVAGIERLRKATEAAGRPRDSVALTYRVKRYGEALPAKGSDGNRRLFSGSDVDIIRDIRVLEELGVTAIDFDFERPEADAVIAEMGASASGCWRRSRAAGSRPRRDRRGRPARRPRAG